MTWLVRIYALVTFVAMGSNSIELVAGIGAGWVVITAILVVQNKEDAPWVTK